MSFARRFEFPGFVHRHENSKDEIVDAVRPRRRFGWFDRRCAMVAQVIGTKN